MDTTAVATPPVEMPTAPSEPQTPPAPTPEETSVAAHVAKFSPQAIEAAKADAVDDLDASETPAQAAQRARDEQGRFARERHRARSDRARPEDVPRIQKLTAKLREAERRLAELEAKGTPKVEAPLVPPTPQIPNAPEARTFTEREPVIDDFANEADPYLALSRAYAKWDRRREAFEAEQAATTAVATQATENAVRQHEEWLRAAGAAYTAREQAFAGRTPDYHAKVQAIAASNGPATPLLLHSLLVSDNGPELVYYLATHPSVYDEMVLLTDGKPITEHSVALTQRQLTARSQAAQTGSVTAAPFVKSIPKPPNPVRTGPMKSGDDPPGDGHSVADHARYWGPSARR